VKIVLVAVATRVSAGDIRSSPRMVNAAPNMRIAAVPANGVTAATWTATAEPARTFAPTACVNWVIVNLGVTFRGIPRLASFGWWGIRRMGPVVVRMDISAMRHMEIAAIRMEFAGRYRRIAEMDGEFSDLWYVLENVRLTWYQPIKVWKVWRYRTFYSFP
jgi:hypothetical protein